MTLIGSKYAETLKQFDHRPFAIEQTPWIINQSWCNLLFAHWHVPQQALRALVPEQLELDLFEGQAYIAVVPFEMREVSPRLIPSMPWLSFFPELNVRTYVRYKGKPGVYFFSLDAGNPVAVWLACNFYHLPYCDAKMQCQKNIVAGQRQYSYTSVRLAHSRTKETTAPSANSAASRHSEASHDSESKKGSPLFNHKKAELDVTYGPTGSVYNSTPGSLEHFLTERYCLFTVFSGTVYRGDIHHKPWPLQPARAQWRVNTMTAPLGLELKDEPILHFVENIDTVEWPIKVG
ncbi:MAG: DUF2071 domain-containing protein [Candidatus Obscuribacterales bacterium]